MTEKLRPGDCSTYFRNKVVGRERKVTQATRCTVRALQALASGLAAHQERKLALKELDLSDNKALLAEKAGETVARYDLVSSASEINERTIDVQINRLRRKIENDPANPLYLQTVRGIGYRLSRD